MSIQEQMVAEGHILLKEIEVKNDPKIKMKLCQRFIEILEELDVDIEAYHELWRYMGIRFEEYIALVEQQE